MGRRARRKQEENTSRGAASAKPAAPETPGHNWPGEGSRYLVPVGVGLIVLLTLIIYGTTLPLAPIEFDDPFYLIRNPYVNVANPFGCATNLLVEPARYHPTARCSQNSSQRP